MSYQTGVLEALRDHGLQLRFVPGYERRGSPTFTPRGHVWHHDAIGARYLFPPPSIFVDGRPDVPPPLCNFNLPTDGIVTVVALGRANHAGLGSYAGLVGNTFVWGTECQNAGDDLQLWPERQGLALVTLDAALADYDGRPRGQASCRHAEWARLDGRTSGPVLRSRKIDPAGPLEGELFDGHHWADGGFADTFRRLTINPLQEDDLTDDQATQLAELHQAVTGQKKLPFGLRKVLAAAQQAPVSLVRIDGQRGQWATDLRTRWQLHKFTAVAADKFGVPTVQLDKAEGQLFLDEVPDRTATS